MNNLDTDAKNPTPDTAIVEPRRPFVEPQISDPAEVVKGNPAAGPFFAVVFSL